MPTPERIKAASREKRKRVCVICGTGFLVRNTCCVGRTCSKECGREHMRRTKTGLKQSAETKAKRSQTMKAVRADPEKRAAWQEATAAGIRRWHEDPANAAAFAERSSERMKRRHADPEWQKVRDERSSRTMKATWERQRDHLVAASVERYARGLGIASEDAKRNKAIANKWILKHAQEALHTETDYNQVYAEVQARLRRETPYDGPQEGSDYIEYLSKLGRLVTSSPECRAIADTFLSEAIPRFASAWNARKAAAPRIETRSDETRNGVRPEG